MIEKIIAGCVFFISFGAFVLIIHYGRQDDTSSALYHIGDMVQSRLDHRKGIVEDIFDCSPCSYNVKFAVNAMKTDTHLFSEDGPITALPYHISTVNEVEIEKAE